MILGIGSDIVDHSINLKFLKDQGGEKFIARILSTDELAAFNRNPIPRFIAGRFAAKEATLKCLGTGMRNGISLREISITNNEEGQPLLSLTGTAKIIADRLGISKWHVSISHSQTHSMAFVIAEK